MHVRIFNNIAVSLFNSIDALSCYVCPFPLRWGGSCSLRLMIHITEMVVAALFVISCVYTEATHSRVTTSVLQTDLVSRSSPHLPPPSCPRLTLQQKAAELARCLEEESRTKNQLQEEAATKDARLHELEVKVKTQRERTKSLTEQVSDVTVAHLMSICKHQMVHLCSSHQ